MIKAKNLKIGVPYVERDDTNPVRLRAGTLAEQDANGNFRVTCPQCWVDMGTMKGKTLLRAIVHNLDRGGVLCPECREVTCDFCGITSKDSKLPWLAEDQLKELDTLKCCQECAELLVKTRWVIIPF